MKMANAKSRPRFTKFAAVGTAVFFATRRIVEPPADGIGEVSCAAEPGPGRLVAGVSGEGSARGESRGGSAASGCCVLDPGRGPLAREVGQQPNANACGQVFLHVGRHDGPATLGPRGPRDVEVGPWHVADEVREEPRR